MMSSLRVLGRRGQCPPGSTNRQEKVMNNKKRNKEIHAAAIRKKYFLENKHILVAHGIDYWAYNRGSRKRKLRIYISNDAEAAERTNMNELRAPETLDKYLKLLKEGAFMVYDIDTSSEYESLDDYLKEKMILRLAGVE